MELSNQEFLERFDDSSRRIAKLMARENITVVHAAVKTASFDIKSRTLRLPFWKTLTPNQLDLLIAHEVSHALYTDMRYVDAQMQTKGLRSYLNIVEDARIERLIQSVYPGLSTVFYEGYQTFATTGPLFHEYTDARIQTMSLIDRINMHYKIGAFRNIPFSKQELPWLDRIDAALTLEEVIQIARELHADAKNQKSATDEEESEPGADKMPDPDAESESGNESDDDKSDSDEDESEGTESDDEDESDEDVKKPSAPSKENEEDSTDAKSESDPAAETDQTLEDTAIDLGLRYLTLPVLTDKQQKAHIITSETMLSTATNKLGTLLERGKDLHQIWQQQHMPTIRHMTSEFLARRDAQTHQKAKISKTGLLNTSKLHAYAYADDLFRRSIALPKGQSHGIVVMIDGSGSMSDVFPDVLDQLMIFAMFAKQAQIPFRGFMFGDHMGGSSEYRHMEIHPGSVRLVSLVDTTKASFLQQLYLLQMSRAVFAKSDPLGNRLLTNGWEVTFMNLTGTPLWSGLIVLDKEVELLKQQFHLDKMSVMIISDGGDTSGLLFTDENGRVIGLNQSAPIVRDARTKKVYVLSRPSGTRYQMQTPTCVPAMLSDVFLRRHNARVIWLHLSQIGSTATTVQMHASPVYYNPLGIPMSLDANDIDRACREQQLVVPSGVSPLTILLEPNALRLVSQQEFTPVAGEGVKEAFLDYASIRLQSKRFARTVMPFLT